MSKLFFGGVRPPHRKTMSHADAAPKTVQPAQVIIPLQQHIGAPCVPLVAVGDTVRRGEKIGDGEGLCAAVHASVSGTVCAIEPRPHPVLGSTMAVVIDNDGEDRTVTQPIPNRTQEGILAAIRQAGVVGMGGAAFPTDVKALSAIGKIDTLIGNGCECEPYITADACLMGTQSAQVLEGLTILAQMLHPKRTVLAIEDNKPQAIAAVQACLDRFPTVELRILPTLYPQGSEKQLVQAITGREVPPGRLPASAGCAIFNVSTAAAVYRAVVLGSSVTERIVTVTGEAVAQPQNFIVPIGTTFRVLVEAAGGLVCQNGRVINGGAMMGIAQSRLDVPVVKATNAVLCLGEQRSSTAEKVCIRCGKCTAVCPVRLQPLYLYRYINLGDIPRLWQLHLTDCVECGSCSYICPGRLPLTERFRVGKRRLKEAEKK